jgi:hypothetical protein
MEPIDIRLYRLGPADIVGKDYGKFTVHAIVMNSPPGTTKTRDAVCDGHAPSWIRVESLFALRMLVGKMQALVTRPEIGPKRFYQSSIIDRRLDFQGRRRGDRLGFSSRRSLGESLGRPGGEQGGTGQGNLRSRRGSRYPPPRHACA